MGGQGAAIFRPNAKPNPRLQWPSWGLALAALFLTLGPHLTGGAGTGKVLDGGKKGTQGLKT